MTSRQLLGGEEIRIRRARHGAANPTRDLRKVLLRESHRVLHIGAHHGQEAAGYADLRLEALWIEGDPEAFEILAKNIEAFPKQEARCALLADRDGEERSFFTVSNEGMSSSLYRLNSDLPWKIEQTGEKKLKTVTLDAVLAAELNPDYPYWVIDVQGAELLVLKGASRSLASCKYLELEVSTFPQYQEQPLFSEVADYLDKEGFFPVWSPGSDYHGDILFLRR